MVKKLKIKKAGILIIPFTIDLKYLKDILAKYNPAVFVDTRANPYKGRITKRTIDTLSGSYGFKQKPSVRLSEKESMDSTFLQGAITRLVEMAEDSFIILFGGTEDYNTNHLIYNIGYKLKNSPIKVMVHKDNTSFYTLTEALMSVPEGGYFGDFKCVPVSTEEGYYYNKLIDVMFETRLSDNYILRDFMLCVDTLISGIPNIPDYPTEVIKAGKKLCAEILEPIKAKWGSVNITYGYQNRLGMEQLYTDKQKANKTSSSPHQWDRGTYSTGVYARIDILPKCVSSGDVSRDAFAKWLMYNLDIDLLMQWKLTDIYCVTISPKPRRVWLEWVPQGSGTNGGNRITKMGESFWCNDVHRLGKKDKPKFLGSVSNGKMWV